MRMMYCRPLTMLIALLFCLSARANDDRIFRNGFDAQVCGNAVIEGTETCDDGGNSATCDFDCTLPSCGDDLVNKAAGETCDDGNFVSGDGCAACLIETCGNGVVSAREQCDDGNGNDLDDCRNNCQLPRCGDGVASTGEACDDGGNTATCDFNCTLPVCGDGLVNNAAGETCDDGNFASGDGCAQCQIETCGARATASGDIRLRDNLVSKRHATVLWRQRSP